MILPKCKNENAFVDRFIRELTDLPESRILFQKHEEKFYKGVPDVSFEAWGNKHGWIEAKYVKRYSHRNGEKCIILERWTSAQRQWLLDRYELIKVNVCCLIWCEGDVWRVGPMDIPNATQNPLQRVTMPLTSMYGVDSWRILWQLLITG